MLCRALASCAHKHNDDWLATGNEQYGRQGERMPHECCSPLAYTGQCIIETSSSTKHRLKVDWSGQGCCTSKQGVHIKQPCSQTPPPPHPLKLMTATVAF